MATPWRGQSSKPAAQAAQVSNTQFASVSTSKDVVLNLTTAEGDKVSISLAASSQSDYLNYLETGQDADGSYARQLQMFSTASSQDFTMSVQGDLNEQELKDLGTVLTTVDKMMTNFVQGRLEPMMAKAAKLARLDTVSELTLEMSYSRQVSVAQQTQVQQAPDPLGTTYNAQGQLNDAQLAAAPVESDAAQLQSQIATDADNLSTAMAKQLARVQDYADYLHNALNRIFDKHRRHVEKSNPNNAAGPALIDRIHKDLLDKMKGG
jgi:hypothetical protein